MIDYGDRYKGTQCNNDVENCLVGDGKTKNVFWNIIFHIIICHLLQMVCAAAG